MRIREAHGGEMHSALDKKELVAKALSLRSARTEPWGLAFLRPLTDEDLIKVFTGIPRPADTKAPLARIGDAHHMLARLLAQGKPVPEISAITGYAPARIRTLESDPAMRELIAHYTETEVFASADIKAQVQHVALAAKDVLLQRLEEEPESFSNKDLQALMTAGLDRIGHGPTTNHNVNINDPAKVIDGLRSMFESEAKGRIIARDSIEATFQVIEDVTLAQGDGT